MHASINPDHLQYFVKILFYVLLLEGFAYYKTVQTGIHFSFKPFSHCFFFSSAKLKPKPSQVLQEAPPSATDASSGSTACLLPTVAHSQLQMCPSKMIHSHTVLYPKPQSVVLLCGRQLIFYF